MAEGWLVAALCAGPLVLLCLKYWIKGWLYRWLTRPGGKEEQDYWKEHDQPL